MDRLTYYVLFPALLVRELANTNLGPFDPLPMIGALMLALYTMVGLVLVLRPIVRLDGPSFTSIFQGALRFNSFIGLSTAAALYGPSGVALFALCVAVLVPQLNILSVAVLVRWGSRQVANWRQQFLLILQNPLIIACLIGIAFNVTNVGLPPIVGPVLDALGKAALPFGLMTVGAGLDLKVANDAKGQIALTCALKLVIFPVLIAGIFELMGIDGEPRAIAILWAALPTASSGYILARQLGGNAGLAAAVITATTLVAGLTIAPILAILN